MEESQGAAGELGSKFEEPVWAIEEQTAGDGRRCREDRASWRRLMVVRGRSGAKVMVSDAGRAEEQRRHGGGVQVDQAVTERA